MARKQVMLVVLMSVVLTALLTAGVGYAAVSGTLDPTDGPTGAGSQMYTLEQIYDRLDTGAAETKMTGFTEPVAGPGATMHTLDEIYALIGERAPVAKTGQEKCYDPTGSTGDEITCTDTGQDGEYQKGVAWPNPRFITGTTGVVTDTLTGLIWLTKANCFGAKNWETALSDANGLASGPCGLTDGSSAGDWRLPNRFELESLLHLGVFNPSVPNTSGTGQWTEGDPFSDVQASVYWSSTSYAGGPFVAWFVDLSSGYVGGGRKTNDGYVWPVRGGQ